MLRTITTRQALKNLATAIRRAVIAAQSEALCVPGFLTPAWQQTYGRKDR